MLSKCADTLDKCLRKPKAVSCNKKLLPKLFIIAGCNGAGKTTASFTMLPEILNIKEFVNADEIARGLSPFQPETVSIEAGKIMLRRLQELIFKGEDFAFETTLSTRSFIELITKAKENAYTITLIFYYLDTVELAIERVKKRVSEGGHNIPTETIIRRYHSGLKNFFYLYKDKVDFWILMDNSLAQPEFIAENNRSESLNIANKKRWDNIIKFVSK